MTLPPRSVFGQLALVIALVLLGAAALALLLGSSMAVRPAVDQIARSMDGFATVIEAQLRTRPREEVLAMLHDTGFELRDAPPPASARVHRAPMVRALQEFANEGGLGAGRELRTAADAHGVRLWLKLDAAPAPWIAFPVRERRGGAPSFAVALLAACVVLVWLAAAYFARRLVQPLRRLAAAAPALVRGEEVAMPTIGGPREVRELGGALERSAREVREAAQDRTLMLAGISHDLRTPLTRVQFALELLPDTDPELRAGIARDIAEIDAILSQFVAYARDGRDENSEMLDLAAVCRNAVTAVGGGDWEVDVPTHATLRGRPMALLRAVENLVVNAQHHGAAPFELRLSRDGDAWRVEVADHGSGLDREAAERVRQPFVRSAARESVHVGSGLGLAIVERVARQHGGELQLLPNCPHGLRAVLSLRGA